MRRGPITLTLDDRLEGFLDKLQVYLDLAEEGGSEQAEELNRDLDGLRREILAEQTRRAR